MKVRMVSMIFITGFALNVTALSRDGQPKEQTVKTQLSKLRGTQATIKYLLASYETTKDAKLLETIETIIAEKNKNKMIREKNHQETITMQWHYGMCISGIIMGGWAVLKIISLFDKK